MLFMKEQVCVCVCVDVCMCECLSNGRGGSQGLKTTLPGTHNDRCGHLFGVAHESRTPT